MNTKSLNCSMKVQRLIRLGLAQRWVLLQIVPTWMLSTNSAKPWRLMVVSQPIMKLSKDKITLPGRKQVYRFQDDERFFRKDIIALADEKVGGEPLLVKVMENGKLNYRQPSLNEIRAKASDSLSKLPAEFKLLTNAPLFPVELSEKLQELIKTTKLQLTKNEINIGAL